MCGGEDLEKENENKRKLSHQVFAMIAVIYSIVGIELFIKQIFP